MRRGQLLLCALSLPLAQAVDVSQDAHGYLADNGFEYGLITSGQNCEASDWTSITDSTECGYAGNHIRCGLYRLSAAGCGPGTQNPCGCFTNGAAQATLYFAPGCGLRGDGDCSTTKQCICRDTAGVFHIQTTGTCESHGMAEVSTSNGCNNAAALLEIRRAGGSTSECNVHQFGEGGNNRGPHCNIYNWANDNKATGGFVGHLHFRGNGGGANCGSGSDVWCVCKRPIQPSPPPPGNFLFVLDNPGDWNAARADCLSRGGDLASIHSFAERDDAFAKIEAGNPTAPKRNVWTGLHCTSTGTACNDKSNWAWIDGLPLTLGVEGLWDSGEPNGGQPCAGIKRDNSGWGNWGCSANDDTITGYLCRLPPEPQPPAPPAPPPTPIAACVCSGTPLSATPSASCSAAGDPHYRNFYSRKFDFYSRGLYEHASFTIEPCGCKVTIQFLLALMTSGRNRANSIIVAAAVRVGLTTFTVTQGGLLSVYDLDGQLQAQLPPDEQASNNQFGGVECVRERTGNHWGWRIVFPANAGSIRIRERAGDRLAPRVIGVP